MSAKNILQVAIASSLLATNAYAELPISKDSYGIFGVTVKGHDPVLTRKVVQAAADAASAYGIQRHHVIETIDGLELAKKFDAKALTPIEQEALDRSSGQENPLQHTYVVVTGVFGGGCVAAPTWSLPAIKSQTSVPVGITNMRCAKTDAGFNRLMKVAQVAMGL